MVWYMVLVSLLSFPLVFATDYTNNTDVQLFQKYIQIDTTTNNDLTPAVEFWLELANEEGLPVEILEFVEGYPVIVIKWQGANCSLESIQLNSHMDVVPADESDGWTYPPFSGYLDENGTVWGRGTQDMKSVGLQHFLAMKSLKDNNVTLQRTVYQTLMPDEEIGGQLGMVPFINSSVYADMNVGFEMDESGAYAVDPIVLVYQDKAVWQFRVDCIASGGHGSSLATWNDTAVGKCINVMNTFYKYREEEYEKYLVAGVTNAGAYSSVNLNIMSAGEALNVIPTNVSLYFDVRLNITADVTEFDAMLQKMVSDSGDNITLTYTLKNEQTPATVLNSSNPYWTAFAEGVAAAGVSVIPVVAPGATDGRYVRGVGIPALGFSPMPDTTFLNHVVDERLSAETFVNGIGIFATVLEYLGNISGEATVDTSNVYLQSSV